MTYRWYLVSCLLVGLALIMWGFLDDPVIGGGLGLGKFQILVIGAGMVTMIVGFLPKVYAVQYLVTLAAVFGAVIVAEIILQHLYAPKYYTAYAPDARALFKLRPGAVRDYTHQEINGGRTITFRINSSGFRGPELRPKQDQFRIVVYGDSFIQAEFTEHESTFTTKLEHHLKTITKRDFEVINAGVAGYGPDQILRRQETELDQLKPDLVLVGVFSGNDFGDLLRNRLYRLDEYDQLIENKFRISDDTKRGILLNKYEPISRKLIGRMFKGLGGNQQLASKFDPKKWLLPVLQQHKSEYEDYVLNGNNTVGSFGVDPYSADIAFEPNSQSARYRIKLMRAILQKMKLLSEEKNVGIAIINIPHPIDLLDGEHSSGIIDKAKFAEYKPSRLTDLIQGLAADAKLPQLNLFPAFKEVEVNDHFLKGGDDHWNPLGQEFAAKITAEFIVEHNLLN